MNNPADCQEFKPLLAGLLDRELSAEETRTINDHLIRCANCRHEYETMAQDAAGLDALLISEPRDHNLATFWRLPYSSLVRNSGLLLFIGGYVAFLGYGLVQFMADDGEWLFGKLATAAMVVGGLILLGIVIIERVISYRTDPYKEVER